MTENIPDLKKEIDICDWGTEVEMEEIVFTLNDYIA